MPPKSYNYAVLEVKLQLHCLTTKPSLCNVLPMYKLPYSAEVLKAIIHATGICYHVVPRF